MCNHSDAVALSQDRLDVAAVRQAIVDSVANLDGFSFPAAAQKSDKPNVLQLHFYTGKLRYFDVIDIEISDNAAAPVSSAHVVSTSSNFCPTIMPFALCRCCCGWAQFFGDGGYNEGHVRVLSGAQSCIVVVARCRVV